MPVISTETQRLSNLIKRYDTPDATELHHELVTVNEAAASTYKVGTVLGKVTATGKYIISKQAASDGSQNPVAIVIGKGDATGNPEDFTVPATTDTKVLALVRGKVVVSKGALLLDASFSTANQKFQAYESLKTVSILAETTV